MEEARLKLRAFIIETVLPYINEEIEDILQRPRPMSGLPQRGVQLAVFVHERPRELVRVQNMEEYSSGCSLHHSGCFGHMCITPTGALLPPHALSFRSGDITTQYYSACNWAFYHNTEQYVDQLKRTNNGKEGHLRSIMSTPVSGSARLVAIPHVCNDYWFVYISRNLAEKIVSATRSAMLTEGRALATRRNT